MSNIFFLTSSLKTKEHENISLEILSGRKLSGKANKESWSWASPTSMSLWRILAPSSIPGNQGLPQKYTLRRALAAAWSYKGFCCTWKIIQIWSPLHLFLQFPHPHLSRLNFSPDCHTPCSSRNHQVLYQGRFATFLYSAGSAWVRSFLRQPVISSLSSILDTGRVTNHPRLHRTIWVLAQKIWYPWIMVTLETGITQDLLQCL